MRFIYAYVWFVVVCYPVQAVDWPMWRYDASRSAITSEKLSYPLTMLWTRRLRAPKPAWHENQETLQFDSSYEPIVMGKLIIVPSMVSDSVTAYETQTGKEVWRFYSDGPVRFAPVAYNGKVYFGSDDGWLYCLKGNTGKCLWKFFAGPVRPMRDGKTYVMKEDERWILGNGRFISAWPVRGAPVIYDGKIYIAAGIFPFMGIFVHAVDAETGKLIWSNTGNSMDWQLQPHHSESFAGLVPQGYIAATDSFIIIPGGRTAPGIYDRRSGKLRYLELATPPPSGKGDYKVVIAGNRFFSGGTMFSMRDGSPLLYVEGDLYDRRFVYSAQENMFGVQEIQSIVSQSKFERLQDKMSVKLMPAPERIFLRAHNTFLCARADGTVMAIAMDNTTVRIVWSAKVDGEPWSMLVGDGKVFIVTYEGGLYCFGEGKSNTEILSSSKSGIETDINSRTNFVKTVLEMTNFTEGYCLVAGADGDAIATEILRRSNMHVIMVTSDRVKLDAFRRLMEDADVYGIRTAGILRDPQSVRYPPYFADLICLSEQNMLTGTLKLENLRYLIQALKPYGGILCVPVSETDTNFLKMLAEKYGGSEYKTGWREGIGWIKREGKLPGAGWWTHQNADSCNTSMSEDHAVKAPFSVLWFGGPSNERVLPRHGHGPTPHVVNGRLIIEGRDMLRAVDVYTGRLLWEYDAPGIGAYYDRTYHHPGANEVGGNYVSLPDAIYALAHGRCIVLDPATGKKVKEISFTSSDGSVYRAGWLSADGSVLAAVCSPFRVPSLDPGDVPPPDSEVLIPAGAIWEYYVGEPKNANWKTINGNIRGWSTDRAGFGYGIKVQTNLREMQGKTMTLCLRKEFYVLDPATIKQIIIMAKHDDEFTCYLNGYELVKVLGEDKRREQLYPKTWPYLAKYEEIPVSDVCRFLKKGSNIFAIEARNKHINDMRFLIDPYVVAVRNTDIQNTRETISFTTEHTAVQTNVITSAEGTCLVVVNQHSGKLLWERKATMAFRHNTVVIGSGKLFCVDGLSAKKRLYLTRRGLALESVSTLYAFDLNTGKVIWQKQGETDAFGTWSIYSEKYDALVVGGAAGRDRPFDEKSQGMAVYRGSDGHLFWKKPELVYSGPCIVRDRMIITQPGFFAGIALDLLTGTQLSQVDPITGISIPWTVFRRYGCGSAIGGWNIITFRSASAGFFDMVSNYGTSNLGGIRAGCTPNVIPADGVLSLPDYTRTCTCLYQHQTSLAVIHDPDAEMWSFAEYNWNGLPVRRVGINFGAPGDRKSDDGTVWMDYPSVGGPSPDLPVRVEGNNVEYYRHHASFFTGTLPWIGCSGVIGAEMITLQLAVRNKESGLYTVRLYFAEPDIAVGAGDRIFEIWIEKPIGYVLDFLKPSKSVSQHLVMDIVKEAGYPRVVVVKELKNVECVDALQIQLLPRKGRTIISGIEIIRQSK